MKTLIYKHYPSRPAQQSRLNKAFSIQVWRPSPTMVIPPRKGKKYIIYWLFHYLGVFCNKYYGAVLVKENGKLIASLLVVPAHFKWSFMAADDLQFTYVITDPEYRGKGIGTQMLQFAIQEFQKAGRVLWYVTDSQNIPSQRLAEKNGFCIHNYTTKEGLL